MPEQICSHQKQIKGTGNSNSVTHMPSVLKEVGRLKSLSENIGITEA